MIENEEVEIIKLKQLPEIVERLDLVSQDIKNRVLNALKLECNEDTVKEIKSVRADFNKEFKILEERRKDVKNQIMEKYNAFEEVYKEKISNIYKNADEELKSKIDNVENNLKEEKRKELEDFFEEQCIANNVKVDFDRIGLNITLTASMKSLKEQAKTFIEKIASDLKLIEMEEFANEILVEYRKTLDFVSSKTIVLNRHKEMQEIQNIKEEQNEAHQQEEKIEKQIDEITAPVEIIEDSEEIEVQFVVKGKKEDIKKIKDLIIELGLEYK